MSSFDLTRLALRCSHKARCCHVQQQCGGQKTDTSETTRASLATHSRQEARVDLQGKCVASDRACTARDAPKPHGKEEVEVGLSPTAGARAGSHLSKSRLAEPFSAVCAYRFWKRFGNGRGAASGDRLHARVYLHTPVVAGRIGCTTHDSRARRHLNALDNGPPTARVSGSRRSLRKSDPGWLTGSGCRSHLLFPPLAYSRSMPVSNISDRRERRLLRCSHRGRGRMRRSTRSDSEVAARAVRCRPLPR